MIACKVCGVYEPFQGLTDESCLIKTKKTCIFDTPPIPSLALHNLQFRTSFASMANDGSVAQPAVQCSAEQPVAQSTDRSRNRSTEQPKPALSSDSRGRSAEQPDGPPNDRPRSRSRQTARPISDSEDMQDSWESHQHRRRRWREWGRGGGGRGRSAEQLAARPNERSRSRSR